MPGAQAPLASHSTALIVALYSTKKPYIGVIKPFFEIQEDNALNRLKVGVVRSDTPKTRK